MIFGIINGVGNIEVAYSQNQMKYSAVKADMAAVDKQLKENNNLTDDQREKLEDAKAALESQSKTLRDNCTSLRMQYSALVQASSAYQDWLNAQNAAEAGDMYNDGMDAKQAIAAGLKNGKIGTEKYKAAVEFLVPDDFKGDVQTYIKKLNRYFKEASDGSIDASGLNNFITDSIKAGLMKDEGDGKIQMIADTTIEDFADALQLTPDAVQSIFGELQEYGWNFDWDSMLGNELDNTRMKLDDIKDQMADLDPDTEAWKILNDQAEKLQEKLDGLYEKSGIDQMVSDINDVLKDTGSLTGNQKDDLLGMGRVQTMVDLYDAQQRLIEAQKAFNANPGDLNIAQELTDAQKQVEELTQKKEKLGDPTALEIQVYTQDAIDKLGNVEGAADQVTDKLEKAGVLTVESDDDPVKETDKEIDNVQEKAKKPITLKVDNVQCLSGIQDVATALKDISGETTVTVRYKTFGKPASTPSTKKTYDATTQTLKISCLDLMSGLNGELGGTLIGSETQIPKGSDIRDAMVKTVTQLGGVGKYRIGYQTSEVPYDMSWDTGTTVWEILEELRDLYYSYEMFFDEDTFVCQRVPMNNEEPLVLTDDVFGKFVISESLTNSFSEVKNVIEVWGVVCSKRLLNQAVGKSLRTHNLKSKKGA